MPIPVVCACSAKLKVGDHLQGKHIKCPKCGALIPVGAAGGAAAFAPPPVESTPPTSAAVLADSALSLPQREQVAARLEPDERLVWADRPDARIALFRGCLFSVGFAFAAAVFAAILAIMGVNEGFKGTVGTVLAVLLGLIAAGLLVCGVGLPFVLRWRTGRTFYAFTTRRALAWPCDWFGRTQLAVYSPSVVSGVQRESVSSDVGNLVFAAERVTRKTREGTELTNQIRRHGFFLIRRPEEVERLLRETLIDPYLDRIYQ